MRVRASRVVSTWLIAGLWVAAAGAAEEAPLADAMKRGDRPAVEALLKKGVPVDASNPDGSTALLWAAHRNDLQAIDLLLRAGAKPNTANALGVTPLSVACTNANAFMVSRLILGGANANIALRSGETPLMTCVHTGNVEAVTRLLAAGADVNAVEPWQQQTALMWAAAQEHTAVVETLLAGGAKVGLVSKSGFTALHFAARSGALDAAKLLMKAGAKVNETAKDGSTPLLVSTVRGNVPVALYLLDEGADPNIETAGFTPLHWAAGTWETRITGPFGYVDPMGGITDRSQKIALIKTLLAKGAKPDAQTTRNPPRFGPTSFRMPLTGATPFFLASYSCDIEVMRLLVAGGANPTLPTRNKTTPLMAAAGLNRPQGESPVTEEIAIEAVKVALELGNNAAAPNDLGENVLHGVAYFGWNKLMQLLVEKGAPINAVTKQGLTPYIIASGHGDRAVTTTVVYHKDTAEWLLKMGADPKLGIPIF